MIMMIYLLPLFREQVEIPFLHRHSSNTLWFLQISIPNHICSMFLLPSFQRTYISTLLINAEIWKWVPLGFDPLICNHVGIRVTEQILQDDISAMSEMN